MVDGFFRGIAIKHRYRRAAVLAGVGLADIDRRGATGAFDLLHADGELGAFRLREFTNELFFSQKVVERGEPTVTVRARLIGEASVFDAIIG